MAIVMETFFLFISSKVLAYEKWLKPVLFFILIITVLRWALCSFAEAPWAFVGLHGLHGITFGLFHAWVVYQLTHIFPASLRQTAQGWLIGAGYGLGGALGMGTGGAILQTGTIQDAWMLMAGFALIALVAGTLFSLLKPVSRTIGVPHV
jgi:MFS family permease